MRTFCRRANTAIRHTLLFIAYHYPPIRSSGIERALHFVRCLPEFGYTPLVLTTAAGAGILVVLHVLAAVAAGAYTARNGWAHSEEDLFLQQDALHPDRFEP